MSQMEVERFLGRLVTDSYFRSRVVVSFEETVRSEGFVLSPAERSMLGTTDFLPFAVLTPLLSDSLRRS